MAYKKLKEKDEDILTCTCTLKGIDGEPSQTFTVYGSHDIETFAKNNQGLIIAYERYLKSLEWVKLKKNLRSQISQAVKNNTRPKSLEKYGINVGAIIEHLGPKPQDDRYEIDHIIPLSAFDFSIPEQITQAFAPTNHQWLKKSKNIKKSDNWKYEGRKIKGKTWV